jgi:hypothetical protein
LLVSQRDLIAERLPRQFAERKPVAIQIFDNHLANPMRSYPRWRQDRRAATLQVGVKAIYVVHVQINVAFERGPIPLPLRQVPSPNLEVDPHATAFHNRVNSAGLVGRGLKHPVNGIETEAEYIAIVLCRLTYVPNPENRRCLPCLVAHRAPPLKSQLYETFAACAAVARKMNAAATIALSGDG